MDLDSMKYAQLRSIAKDVGIKASKLKSDKLLKALKEHFQRQQLHQDVPVDQGDETGTAAQDELSPEPPTQEFVTKRRGKGRTNKRKLLEDEKPECELDRAPLTPAEDVEEVAKTSVGRHSVKRRRVSATKDSPAAGPEEPSQEPKAETQPGHEDAAPAVTFEKAEVQKAVKPGGKIPRHEGLLKKSMLKPTTPNFKKLHEAHFKRMESIDSYIERKTKQTDMFRSSVKELKVLSGKTFLKPTEENAVVSSTLSCASPFSPAAQKPVTDKRRLTQLSAAKPATSKRRQTHAPTSKPVQKETVVPFRPTVLSTRRINVRFSQATKDNEHKGSTVKTPSRRSQPVDLITPRKETSVGGNPEINKTSVFSSTKKPSACIPSTSKTPAFVFNANSSVLSNTPGNNMKANFDLKASLSKPLTYKPHKGKLKPFGVSKENTSNQSVVGQVQAVVSHQNYKQHQVQTREERRAKQIEDRKEKKEKILGARRGLVMT